MIELVGDRPRLFAMVRPMLNAREALRQRPGASAGIALPELLTPSAVMDAFRRATSIPARRQEATE